MSEQLDVVRAPEVVRTVDVIAAEINGLTAAVFSNVIEIGRRMVEAKELLPHGQFGTWLKANTHYSTSTANNYMRIFEKFGSQQKSLFGAELKSQTFGNLNYSKALAMVDIPDEELESFIKENNIEAMSTRELQKVIKERDEARRERDEALQAGEGTALAMAELQDKLSETREKLKGVREARDEMAGFLRERTDEVAELKAEVKQLQERPVEVAVQEPDQKAIDAAVEEALAKAAEQHKADMQGMQAKLDKEVAENNKLEKRLDKLKAKAAAAENGEEKAKLQAEVEQLTKQLAMAAPEVTTFKVQFGAWQQAYTTMMRTLTTVPGDAASNLRKAIKAQVAEWGKAV